MTLAKFYENLHQHPNFIEGFTTTVSSDILDQSEFWTDDSEEFLEKFCACAETKQGKDFILFLVGHENMAAYLEYINNALDLD